MNAQRDPKHNILKVKQSLINQAKAKGVDTSDEEIEENLANTKAGN